MLRYRINPRGRPRNKIQADEVYDSSPLVDTTTDFMGSKYDIRDDASLLRDHRFRDDGDSVEEHRESKARVLQRLIAFMSTKPLLGGSARSRRARLRSSSPILITEAYR